MKSLTAATTHCINLADFYIQVSFTVIGALSKFLCLHRVFSCTYR